MKVRNEEYQSYHTKRQWALTGYLPKAGERDLALWTNMFHQSSYLYYSSDQVEQAEEVALSDYFRPEAGNLRQLLGYEWGDGLGHAHDGLSDCYATLYCYQRIKAEEQNNEGS